MPGDLVRPPRLATNLWTGVASPTAALSPHALAWAFSRQRGGPAPGDEFMAPPAEAEPWDWRDPRIGWGLVLPDNTPLAAQQRGTASDAPPALQRLLAARPGSPVLRYSEEAGEGYLCRYDGQGGRRKLSLISPPGTQGRDTLPRYLLIAASPREIPWSFQYAVNLSHHVGRLDLEGQALDNYVNALIADFAGFGGDPRTPLVWSVNHGAPDITDLMEKVIARKVHAAFAADKDGDYPGLVGLFGADATCARLVTELQARRPALILSTSHGMTGPFDDGPRMRDSLGMPVDNAHRVLDLAALSGWQPEGAIWYSHACCAAGSDTRTAYSGLLEKGSDVSTALEGVAQGCGAMVSPLPRALLGAARPLRAFIGHVEPTFDWTLRDPFTGQPFASALREALYNRLYTAAGRPVGWALQQVFNDAGTMLGLWAASIAAFNAGKLTAGDAALYYQVSALDRQHTVILGDPTVGLPPLH
jgi:hypothetical protein